MEPDELEPRTPKPGAKNLDVMSIEALADYGAELEAEMVRVRAAIAAKREARSGADAVFKR